MSDIEREEFEQAVTDTAAELAHRDITVLNQQKHIEALQAQVVELVAVAVSVRDDLLLRSEIDSDGTRCVNLSASKWSSFCDVIDEAAKAEGSDNAG